MGQYDVAQICLNGHVITGNSRSRPQFTKDFCDDCGAKTITTCPKCNKPIQGTYLPDNVFGCWTSPTPQFCQHCGKPFPWTEKRIEAAKELIDEIEEATEDEREKAKESLIYITSKTPKTELGATRIVKVLEKAGASVGDSLRQLLIDIASETAVRYFKSY